MGEEEPLSTRVQRARGGAAQWCLCRLLCCPRVGLEAVTLYGRFAKTGTSSGVHVLRLLRLGGIVIPISPCVPPLLAPAGSVQRAPGASNDAPQGGTGATLTAISLP